MKKNYWSFLIIVMILSALTVVSVTLAGDGRCTVYNCGCAGFQGGDNYCDVCGHTFYYHEWRN